MHRGNNAVKIIRLHNIKFDNSFITINNQNLLIFDRERTIVDAFRFLGQETALKALKKALTQKGTEKIKIEKIREYAKKLRVKIESFLLAMTL